VSYSALSFDELGSVSLPFDDGFIDMWAEVLQVRKDVLAAALADAFDEYLSHKLSSNRFEHWQQARDKFEQIHRSLSKTLFLWKSASPTRLIKIGAVLSAVSLSKTELEREIADGSFPMPVRFGPQRITFPAKNVENWILAQTEGGQNDD
jgi:predicted DNA-binding transcriptional regulator AlpA